MPTKEGILPGRIEQYRPPPHGCEALWGAPAENLSPSEPWPDGEELADGKEVGWQP